MITIIRPDFTIAVHKGPCILCFSQDCPGEPCCGDIGGKCVIGWNGDTCDCLASYPPGISYSDCNCEHSPCDHATQLIDAAVPKTPATVEHRKHEQREKAKAAYHAYTEASTQTADTRPHNERKPDHA